MCRTVSPCWAVETTLKKYSAFVGFPIVLNGKRANGRGLHSSSFWLNVSTFCGIRWVHDFPPVH